YLRQEGPQKVRALLEADGAKGRHRIVETIATSFVRETAAGLEHSRSVLQALRGRFRMGVVSNFYGNLDRVLGEARMDRFLDAIADSSRVQVFKPKPGIFEAAIKQLRIAPGAITMVGDSLAKDCTPARKLGLRTVWLCAGLPLNPALTVARDVAD